MDEFDIKLFWERTNSAYSALKKNPIAWKEEQEELLAWDVTLADGLEEEE